MGERGAKMGGPCGVKKGKSKKIKLHRKYREETLVRQHHKKVKKVARKAKAAGIKAPHKREPLMSNSSPFFRDQFLREAEQHKERVADERDKRIEERKAARRRNLAKKRAQSLEEMASNATKRGDKFAKKTKAVADDDGTRALAGVRTRAQYMRQLREVVAMSDIVLVVLDARNPMGCRCKQLEDLIMQSGSNKRVILVLNKIDLVPRGVVQSWLKVLRMELPTIAFKAVTAGVSQAPSNDKTISATSGECLGGSMLLQLVKNYSRSHGIKKAVSVGVVGFPNVGKSSLINSLKRGKVVGTSAQAGFTKSIQEVKLGSKVTLIDSPGVLLAAEDDPDFILRNCTRVDKLTDTTAPVEAIIKRCQKEQLLKMYQIGMFNNVQEFLVQIAEKRGRMMKGGRPDLMAAGRTVLEDWNSGKVPFYTLPPAETKVSAAQASVVAGWGKEFNLQAATVDDIASVESLAARQPGGDDGFMAMESSGPVEMKDLMDDDVSGEDDDMMMDDDEEDDEEDNGERYEVMV